MKKIIGLFGGICVLIALVILLGPLYTSHLVDRQIKSTIATLNHQGMFKARFSDISQGWFSQQRTLTLTPVDQSLRKILRESGEQAIVYHMDIAYGPLAFSAWHRDGVSLMPVGAVIDTRIKGLGAFLRKAGSGYSIRNVVPIKGGDTFTLHIDPGAVKGKDGSLMHWTATDLRLVQRGHGLTGHGQTGALTITGGDSGTGVQPSHMNITPVKLKISHLELIDNQSIGQITLTWNGLQGVNQDNTHQPGVNFKVDSVKLEVDTHLAGGIAAGQANMTLHGLHISQLENGNPPIFDFRNALISTSTSDPKNGYANSTFVMRVDRIDSGPQTFGPIRLELEGDHQYVPALVELTRKLTNRQQMNPQPGEPQKVFLEHLLVMFKPAIQKLLAHQPVLRLNDLLIGTPQGKLKGQGQAHFELANGGTFSMAKLPEELVAHLSLQAPAPLARQLAAIALGRTGLAPNQIPTATQRYLKAFQAQGLLSLKGTDYATSIDYRHGSLTINGHPYPPQG